MIEIALYIVAVLIIVVAAFLFLRKKRDAGTVLGLVGVVLLVATFFGAPILAELEAGGLVPPPSNGLPVGVDVKPISTLSWLVQQKYSGNRQTVDGTIKYFGEGEDPTDPNASYIDSTTIADGNGSDTDTRIQTGTLYRTLLDGSSTYYDYDLGEIFFEAPSTDAASVTVIAGIPKDSVANSFDDIKYLDPAFAGETDRGVVEVGTISDIFTEADNNCWNNDVNGEKGNGALEDGTSLGSYCSILNNDVNELLVTTNSVSYDEADGDGQYKVRVDIACTGGNQGCEDMVVGFEYDTTNPAEGNEVSALSVQLVSGTDMGLPSDMLNYWSNQQFFHIGDLEGGVTAEYDFTFTVNEANMTAAGDVFYLRVDDMGDYLGTDTFSHVKATGRSVTFTNTDA